MTQERIDPRLVDRVAYREFARRNQGPPDPERVWRDNNPGLRSEWRRTAERAITDFLRAAREAGADAVLTDGTLVEWVKHPGSLGICVHRVVPIDGGDNG